MRVIAGKYKGRRLNSPSDENVRPTTDRIKETLFNVLQSDIPDAVVLDLFAGSGALGIESLSRGAEEVIFVDKSKDSINLIRDNLKGMDGNYKITQADFLSALRNFDKKFDVIFIDPPYASGLGEMAVDAVLDKGLLADGGVIVYEHGFENEFSTDRDKIRVRTKKMGTVTAEFIRKKKIALVTGSFDPFTKGHEAVVNEALGRFDEVVVACLVNPDKQYMFSEEERLEIVRLSIENMSGARALFSNKDAVEVAADVGADVLVRGYRSSDDLGYENLMAEHNKKLGFDTMFIEIDGYREISSTRVREELKNGVFHSLPNNAIIYVKGLMKNRC